MQFAHWMWRALALVAIALFAATAAGYDGTVDKKTFTLPSYTTVGGKTIKNVRVGYETYGTTFPVVAYRDSVRVHKALVDSLGVKKLQAVAGASGGSLQAMEWGALYPDFVARVIHVIGPGFDIHPYVVEWLDVWVMPIRIDPKWNGGD